MESLKIKNENALLKISKDRSRTNISKKWEQKLLAFLVQRIPSWITSDMLTGIGFIGTLIVTASFILAAYINPAWLLLNVPGFAIVWFGDSLDGRLAYYRNKPRKWYGFSLDLIVDYLSTVCMGAGLIVYLHPQWKFIGFVFVFLYGWCMMTALLRYKITNVYTIDSGLLGPTELRIVISIILVLEVIIPGSIVYLGIAACVLLLVINISDFIKLLKMADARDKEERLNK